VSVAKEAYRAMRATLDRVEANCRSTLAKLENYAVKRGIPVLSRHDVRTVVVVCASSRGGSSVFFRELSRSPDLLSPRGEQVPFEKLYLDHASHGSDVLTEADFVAPSSDAIWRLLYFDLGVGTGGGLPEDERALYDLQLELRLPLQWPASVSPDDVEAGLSGLPRRSLGGGAFAALLLALERQGKLRRGYYDLLGLKDEALARWPAPPHDHILLEEPPFIPITPRRLPSLEALRAPRVLLKSSLNAYRLPFLQRFFPNARFKVIHLTRNPAASINGLMDGWLHWGFFSRNVAPSSVALRIGGYSDRYPWGERWWKFDLFDGWQDYAGAPLTTVCAQQWARAHHHVLDFTARHPDIDYLAVRFEDLIRGPRSRQEVLDAVAAFLEIGRLDGGLGDMPREAVMTTRPPKKQRWKEREGLIVETVREREVERVAERLGYRFEDIDQEWL
jgi:hypothetical protein